MNRPVAEGVMIGLRYAIGIAELAKEYDKPMDYVIETLKERLEGEEKENASTHPSATSSK